VHSSRAADREFDTLIFDLFGVVISFDEDIVYRRLAQHCEHPERAFVAMRGLVSQDDLIRGRTTLDSMHQQLIAAHGLALNLQDFESAWRAPYSAPIPGMAALIGSLSKSYRLVLLSNVDKHYWEVVFEAHPELHCFSALLLSWELGIAKPDREVFLHAVQAARTARCFFIDDKSENVEAARRVGIRGHRFRSAGVLLEALEREGIR